MDLDQLITDATERINKSINELTTEAHRATSRDFDAAAKRLGLNEKEWEDARINAQVG